MERDESAGGTRRRSAGGVKLLLAIYLLVGCGMSGMVADSRAGAFAWDATAVSVIGGIHAALIGLGWLVATKSKAIGNGNYRYGFSPGGWGIGLFVSYVVGFVGYFVAR